MNDLCVGGVRDQVSHTLLHSYGSPLTILKLSEVCNAVNNV